MDSESPPTLTGVNHIGLLTADVDRAVRVWADSYGVGPWEVRTFDSERVEASVGGEPVELGIRVANCDPPGGGARIELIQPLGESGPYARSLAAHGGADHVHHVRFDTADPDGMAAALRERGVEEGLRASFRGADPATLARATYLDTGAELGLRLEVAAHEAGFEPPPPDYVYPPPG